MTAALRKGDVVSVNGVVLSDPNDFNGTMKVRVKVEPYHDIYVLAAHVNMVRPEFQEGDKVQWGENDLEEPFSGQVLAIANDHLWVDRGDGNFSTVWINEASRVAIPVQAKRDLITHIHENIITDRDEDPESLAAPVDSDGVAEH